MADFTKMAFAPEKGLRDKDAYPSTPASEDDARGSIQGISDQIKDYINDTLIAELKNVTTGTSGAEKLGSAEIDGVSGINVHDQIASLKGQMKDIVAGGIGQGDVHEANIADGAVTFFKLAENAVDSKQIRKDAVSSDKLLAGCVKSEKIYSGAVQTLHIEEKAVTSAKLAQPAVEENNIWPGAVTTAKIWNGAVTSDKLGEKAVDAINIIDGAVIKAKLGTDVPGQLFGTSEIPPTGSYADGTIYIIYAEDVTNA